MNKFKTIALAAVSLSMVAAASAQTTNPISVRAGIVFPIDSSLRDFSNTLNGFGVDFGLGKFRDYDAYISADWITKSLKGNGGNIFPIAINLRRPFGTSEEGTLSYYGFAGIGAAIFDLNGSNTRLAGRLGLGANINMNWFAEATLLLTEKEKSSSARGTSIGLYVGYKF